MTKTEITHLLALITAFDRRTVGEADVEAWHLVLGDLEATDCAEAVKAYFTTSRDWLMPADVRRLAIDAKRRREGAARRAALDAQIAQENPGEIKPRDLRAITAGQPVPFDDPTRVLRRQELRKAAHTRKPALEQDTAAVARYHAGMQQARAELEELRAASRPSHATESDR